MKRHFWLAFFVVPAMAFGLVSDVAANEGGGDNGEGSRTLTAALMGATDVPAALSAHLRGTARITINRARTQLGWDLDYPPTEHVVPAHIHKAPPGVAA